MLRLWNEQYKRALCLGWKHVAKIRKKNLAPNVYQYINNRDPAAPQVYLYRQFGEAGTWMLENMRAKTYQQGGTPVELGIINSAEAPYNKKAYAYPGPSCTGTDPQYFNKLPAIGLLYSWAAVTNNENLP